METSRNRTERKMRIFLLLLPAVRVLAWLAQPWYVFCVNPNDSPKKIQNMANTGNSVAIYSRLVYDVTAYLMSPPAIRMPQGTAQASSDTNVNFMDSSVLNLFKFNACQDITK